MEEEKYLKLLQLWNYPFYQLDMKTIDVKRKVKLKLYVSNYQIVGTFTFRPPQYILKKYKQFIQEKSKVIKFLNDYFVDNSFVKKYKKTVSTEYKNEIVKFFYIFNLSPDAVVDYSIQGNTMTMKFNGVMLYKK